MEIDFGCLGFWAALMSFRDQARRRLKREKWIMGVKLSKPMEAGLLAISWQLVTRKSLAVLPVKGNTRNALEDRGLLVVTMVGSVNGEMMWTLTEAGLAEVDRIQRERDAENANAIRIARERDAQREAVAPSLPILTTRSQVQIVNGDGAQSWGATGGRTVVQRPGTIGKLCKIKKSSAGRCAKWRKGR